MVDSFDTIGKKRGESVGGAGVDLVKSELFCFWGPVRGAEGEVFGARAEFWYVRKAKIVGFSGG